MTIQEFFETQVEVAKYQTGCQVPVVIGEIPEGLGVFSAVYVKFNETTNEHTMVKVVANQRYVERYFRDGSKEAQEHLLNIVYDGMTGTVNLWPHIALRKHAGQSFVGLTYSGYDPETGICTDSAAITAPWNPEAS
jgi:hypothetical protein